MSLQFGDHLPKGWQWRRLSELAEINPRSRRLDEDTLVSFVAMADVSETGCMISSDTRPFGAVKNGYTPFQEGDVLLAKITPCFENGKGAIAAHLSNGIGFGSTEFHVLRPKPGADRDFIFIHTRTREFRRFGEANMTGSAGQKRLPTDFVSDWRVPTPPASEQHRIVKVLSTWDEALERLSRQIESKEELLKSLRERLVHGSDRLGRQDRPWPMVPLSEVTTPLKTRNSDRFGRELVMSVTKADGIVPMREHVVAEDISRYLVLPPNGFAYNPMRINIGSIAMSEHEDNVIVSPAYVVFSCKEDRLHPRFLNHLRRTKAWADFMTIAGSGSVRVFIYYASLAKFEFHLPPLDEQCAIIEVLDNAEREIAVLEAERAALTRQRDALATELLTGRLRVPQAEAAS